MSNLSYFLDEVHLIDSITDGAWPWYALLDTSGECSDDYMDGRRVWHKKQGLCSLSGKTSYRQISRSLKAARLVIYINGIALKFDRHIGTTATEVPVEFQSDRAILNTNLAASRFLEIVQ